MISIKKYMDGWIGTVSNPALRCYLSLLAAVGESAVRAAPDVGPDLDRTLADCMAAIESAMENDSASPDFTAILARTHQDVEAALARSTDAAVARNLRNENELREIVRAMTKAVESITERDERYKLEVTDLTARLHSITAMNDLALIRQAIVDSANSLTACVERTALAGRESMNSLRAEMDEYRSRLSRSERLSSLDPLTGLPNRRGFEERMEARIRAGNRFCLILIDLNGFKEVNDRLGHLAGDEVLKSVAAKLRHQFPSADLVARWGGDEFAVILTCGEGDALARVGRIRRMPIGECRVNYGGRPIDVRVQACFGVVEWNGMESASALLARADDCLYRGKTSRR